MNIAATLRALLEADLERERATARKDHLRAQLATLYEQRWHDDGAAPAGNVKGLGKARWDVYDPTPAVVDGSAFGSWAAQRHPKAVTTTITVPPGELERALQALSFAGVTVVKSEATVTHEAAKHILTDAVSGAEMDDDPATTWVPNEHTGAYEVVPGVQMLKKAPRLVVSLDPSTKRDALATVQARLEAELAAADAVDLAGDDQPTPAPATPVQEYDAATVDPFIDWTMAEIRLALRARGVSDLRGTKAVLRQRLIDLDKENTK